MSHKFARFQYDMGWRVWSTDEKLKWKSGVTVGINPWWIAKIWGEKGWRVSLKNLKEKDH